MTTPELDEMIDQLVEFETSDEQEDDAQSETNEEKAEAAKTEAITALVMKDRDWGVFDFKDIIAKTKKNIIPEDFITAANKVLESEKENCFAAILFHQATVKFLTDQQYKVNRKNMRENPARILNKDMERFKLKERKLAKEKADLLQRKAVLAQENPKKRPRIQED